MEFLFKLCYKIHYLLKIIDTCDQKQDESLLEDIWVLLKAGRLEEACELCRSAGQVNIGPSIEFVEIITFTLRRVITFFFLKPWRASTICPFGGIDHFPSVEALKKNGKNRPLQAIELESGIGRQWRLWRWACYCASEVCNDWFDWPYADNISKFLFKFIFGYDNIHWLFIRKLHSTMEENLK